VGKNSINDEGWVAEMKFLQPVRFEKNSGDIWGLEVARVLYRRMRTSFWQHIPKDAPGLCICLANWPVLSRSNPVRSLMSLLILSVNLRHSRLNREIHYGKREKVRA